MNLVKEVFNRNKILAYTGVFFFGLALIVGVKGIMNENQLLGVNSMIKPLKFALSSAIYAWSMAFLLFYVNNQKVVKWYSILALVVLFYENGVITIQAWRGQLSHFNIQDAIGGILYGFMGIMIVWLTTATLVITIRFMLQKTFAINSVKALSIMLGLMLFVVFSFFGGYMSAVNSHSVGGAMGGEGLPFVNWSTEHGDLRVAHFFGIHSLQVIPLFGFWASKSIKDIKKAKLVVWLCAVIYTSFVLFAVFKAVNGDALL